MKICINYNTSWGVYNFRKELISALLSNGYIVVVISPLDNFTEKLLKLGCQHYNISFKNDSLGVYNTLKYLFDLRRLLITIKPNFILNFTTRPNIFTPIASINLGVKSINNIAGLGVGFKNIFIRQILKILYYFSQRNKNTLHVFFQNDKDFTYFKKLNLIIEKNSSVLPGSGVDLEKFTFKPKKSSEKINFLFASRLLKSKGILELVKCLQLLHNENKNINLTILGEIDSNNKDSISLKDLIKIKNFPFVKYFGKVDNVRYYLSKCDCFVLPTTYNEGTPRSILEALSVGRPVITTDIAGCRDTVVDGFNGFLIIPNNDESLINCLRKFIELKKDEKKNFGLNSREIAENKFDVKIVISKYLDLIGQ